MKTSNLLSEVARSCLFTKGLAAEADPRQSIPDKPTVPAMSTRRLCAHLIMEEALETITAMGLVVLVDGIKPVYNEGLSFEQSSMATEAGPFIPDLGMEDTIDGCCDLIYVAVGTLCAYGVPDLPHLSAVCKANNSKFPNGAVIIDPKTGKYQKPAGFQPPNHADVTSRAAPLNLALAARQLIAAARGEAPPCA